MWRWFEYISLKNAIQKFQVKTGKINASSLIHEADYNINAILENSRLYGEGASSKKLEKISKKDLLITQTPIEKMHLGTQILLQINDDGEPVLYKNQLHGSQKKSTLCYSKLYIKRKDFRKVVKIFKTK